VRVVVVGASSGLGRCIGVGLGERGAQVALLARRVERLESAAAEAGAGAVAVACDVTDEASVAAAIETAAGELGGIDAVVYTPALGPLRRIEDTDAATWRRVFDTNVVGATVVTAAALPHLVASGGTAVYLSSVSASQTAPWPGLGAYATSKAALDKLIEAWRTEHPEVAFTRAVVGDCAGGEGDGATGFAEGWDWDYAAELMPTWVARNLVAGSLIDVEHLVDTIDGLLRAGRSIAVPTIVIAPRTSAAAPADDAEPGTATQPAPG
jgi:NAD(P)-dependent dehydrogenase (short-subunit alcohol dehydrogenase family)